MDIGEILFQFAADGWKKLRTAKDSDAVCRLSGVQRRLEFFTSLLAGREFELSGAAVDWGIVGCRLVLPLSVDVFDAPEQNYAVYLYRIIGDISRLDAGPTASTAPLALTGIQDFQAGMRESLTALALLKGKRAADARMLVDFRPPRDLLDLKAEMSILPQLDGSQPAKAPTSIDVNPSTIQPELKKFDNPEEMNPLSHVFEKLKTVDDFTGGMRQLDDEDELKEHQKALKDLSFNAVIRTDKAGTGAIGGMIAATKLEVDGGAQSEQKVFFYDEWHGGKRTYLPAWCRLREEAMPTHLLVSSPATTLNHRKIGTLLRRRLGIYSNTYRWERRHDDGPEIDMDAFVDYSVDRRRAATPGDRLFLRQTKMDLNFAVTVLCDASLSTESWVAGSQVITMIRDSLLILSYALDDLQCLWSVAAFNSHTRNDCSYQIIKDFQDSAAELRLRVPHVVPRGYTRMGPALRHTAARHAQLHRKHNLLLLLTDAKPTDYDYYDGEYGRNDVKRTLVELAAQDLQTFVITLADKKARGVPEMFSGITAYCSSSASLSENLFTAFSRLLTTRS